MITDSQRVWYGKGGCSKFSNTEFLKFYNKSDAWIVSVFGVILIRIFRIRTDYGEILHIFPYLVRMQENADQNNSKYGHFLRRKRDFFPLRFGQIQLVFSTCWSVTFSKVKKIWIWRSRFCKSPIVLNLLTFIEDFPAFLKHRL